MKKKIATTIGAVTITLLGAPAFGQVIDVKQSSQIETVIVTGSKRDTAIQDSDLSVTVLGAKAIRDARLQDIRRVDDLVPNVQFNQSGQLSSVFVTIRGVESNPFIVNRAAVYIDGIPFRELNNAVLNQVESIEVLRGPQGTLYGANSESGLILIRSRKPSFDSAAELKITQSGYSEGSGIVLDGSISGPITSETLAGSVAFKLSDEDAYVRNHASSINESGEIRQKFVQGRLLWETTEKLTINTMAYVLDLNAPGVFDQEYVPLDVDLYNATYAETLNSGRKIDDFTNLNDAPKRTKERETVVGASASYILAYGQLDGAISYRSEDSDSRGLDFDFTAASVLAGRDVNKEKFWNAEIRFTSPDNNPFEYIVGFSGYSESKSRYFATFVGAGGIDSYATAPEQRADGHDYSAFASGSYSPASLSDFTLSVGLRLDHAHRSARQQQGVLELGPAGQIAYQDATLSGDFDALLPRVSLRYEPTDDLTVFASSAQGYIPGGFNLTAVQDGYDDDNVLRYDSETLWSHELGFKFRSQPHGIQIAGAVFYITSDNWQEIQVVVDDQGRPITSDFIGSAASIESYGAELEGTYQPAEAFQLSANIGYVNSRYRKLQFDETTNLSGNRVKLVPEYDAFIAARYSWPVGWFVRGEFGATGKMPLDERGRVYQSATTTLGLQIGYEDERYSTRIFVENLSNKRRASGLAFDNLAFGTDGNFYAPLDSPRVFGLEFGLRL